MELEQIRTERRGPVLLVTLDRPTAMNAWTWQMSAELSRVFGAADEDDEVRAIVVTGAGRVFCAGADLGGGGETFSGASRAIGPDYAKEARSATPAHRLKTPIIAAINGSAVGAGLTMTMEWDLRVVAEDASAPLRTAIGSSTIRASPVRARTSPAGGICSTAILMNR